MSSKPSFCLSGSCLHDRAMHLMPREEVPGARPYTTGGILGSRRGQPCPHPHVSAERADAYKVASPWFLQSLQRFSEQTCSAQTFSRTRSRAPVTTMTQTQGHKTPQGQLAQLKHPLLQLLQLPSSTPAFLCLQHTDEASASPQAQKEL